MFGVQANMTCLPDGMDRQLKLQVTLARPGLQPGLPGYPLPPSRTNCRPNIILRLVDYYYGAIK